MMEIKHFLECERFALKRKGLTDKDFEEAGMRVYQRYDFNPMAIFAAVGKGGIVMPIVSSTFFGDIDEGLVYSVILTVNRAAHYIELYNPLTGNQERFGLEDFMRQWQADGSDCVTAFVPDPKTYQPQLQDLSDTQLPEDLTALREVLAQHAHDVWANERQSEGWTYGLKRDDHLLQTPDMLPYDELPETERDYDRKMATDILKLLISKGYRIEKG